MAASIQLLAAKLNQQRGVDARGLDFMPFSNLEQSVRDDVEALRSSPLIPKDVQITGAIYHVHTGELKTIA